MLFVDTADMLAKMARETLVHARFENILPCGFFLSCSYSIANSYSSTPLSRSIQHIRLMFCGICSNMLYVVGILVIVVCIRAVQHFSGLLFSEWYTCMQKDLQISCEYNIRFCLPGCQVFHCPVLLMCSLQDVFLGCQPA